MTLYSHIKKAAYATYILADVFWHPMKGGKRRNRPMTGEEIMHEEGLISITRGWSHKSNEGSPKNLDNMSFKNLKKILHANIVYWSYSPLININVLGLSFLWHLEPKRCFFARQQTLYFVNYMALLRLPKWTALLLFCIIHLKKKFFFFIVYF